MLEMSRDKMRLCFWNLRGSRGCWGCRKKKRESHLLEFYWKHSLSPHGFWWLAVVSHVLFTDPTGSDVRLSPHYVLGALLSDRPGKRWALLSASGAFLYSLPAQTFLCVPEKFSSAEQFYQVKRMMKGIGDALSSTCSQTLNG